MAVKQTKKVFEALEVLFKALDAAPLAPATILKSDNFKQHYESLFMFAFRKLQAARYHSERVKELLAIDSDDLAESLILDPPEGKLKVASMVVKKSKDAGEYSYELSAFFAAIRSSIDFLCRACAEHLKGVEADSVSVYLKFLKNGKTGPILAVVAAHAKWLESVRDYRDYLVHNLTLNTTIGGQTQMKGGVSVTTHYPVVVPAQTPRVIHDTRMARMLDEPEHKFIIKTTEAWQTDPEGKSKIMTHAVEMEPGPGYMRIEKLMARELNAFEEFFVDIIQAVTKLKFQPAPII